MLDVAGMIPGVGKVFDAVNGVIYAAEGDFTNAGLSFASCIPVVGNAIGGAKLATADIGVIAIVARGIDKARDASRAVDTGLETSKIANKIHGNSLSTTRKAYGYALKEKTSEKILKYGETINPRKRYSQKYLDKLNARMEIITTATKREMHYWQHEQMMKYYDYNGEYPPYNFNHW